MRLDRGERRDQPLPAGALARSKTREEVDGRGGAGQQLVGQGAEFESLGHVVRGRQELVGRQPVEPVRTGGEHAEVGAAELVRRAGEEVGAHRRHVDGGVRRVVNAVDVEQRPGLVDDVGDLADGRPGADQVGRRGDGDQPGALGDDGRDVGGA